MSSSLNVVLFGEAGVGKSSVINMIAGRHVAETSSDPQECTMSFTPYSFPIDGRTFHIWDTVGLEEPEMGVHKYLPPIEQACELIHNISNRGGVDLLLFCFRGNRVTTTTQSYYRLFYEVLCRSRVPIALVITHLEREHDMESWWERNAGFLEKYGIKAAGHACVTGLPTHSKYRESQRNVAKLLEGHNGQGRFNMPPEGWLVDFLRPSGLFAPLKSTKKKDIIKVLTKRCKLDPKVAKELATKLAPRLSRDREAGPHIVGLERKDGGKPRMIESGVDESPVVVEQARSERVDREQKSGAALADIRQHCSGRLRDAKNMAEVEPRGANVLQGKVDGGVKPCEVMVERARPERADKKGKSGVASTVPGSSRTVPVARVPLSFKELEHLGDAAVGVKRYDEAVTHYSTALSLKSRSKTILIKRSKAWSELGRWKEALDDANQVTTLDPSSLWGYEMKHAALHKIGEYDNAIEAFETMLSKMKHSPDPVVQRESDEYISPSSTQATIRSIVQQTIRHLPRVLINTTTGRLHDRAEHASAFESLPVFKELVSSMTKRINYVRIEQEVREYFRYVMLSHKWEESEPLFQKVIHIAVYDLDESPTHDKLRMFCKIVRDAGFNWAWSDTCCIDQSNNSVLQEALVAMFKWYQGSALMIVFLRGVSSSSQRGALMRSIWNTRAWTLQEYVASKIIHFYTEDWTPYLDLQLPNHKESPEVVLEMEQATGVSAHRLMAIRPGLTSIREKLRLASTRETTRVEDAAYSLLGIFSVIGMPAIYGEGEGSLGRLLAHVLTGSRDVSILAWTGESGSFNSCLPAHITVFNRSATSHLPRSIPDTEMERIIAALQPSPYPSMFLWLFGQRNFDLDAALRLYDRLNELPAAVFAAGRVKLPCIVFQLPPLTPSQTRHVYHADTDAFGTVEIKTRRDLSRMDPLYIVHPWLDALLGHEDMHRGALAGGDVVPLPSPNADNRNEDEGTDGPWLPGPKLRSHPVPIRMARTDKAAQARRLVARLRQPFGALLLTLVSTGGRAVDYKRVAADNLITVQLQEDVSLVDILDSVRILDVL